MDNNNLNKTLQNRAQVNNAERVVCDNCFEHIIFALSDSRGNEFSVGLKTVLECLIFAIDNGELPKLPASWLNDVDNVYHTDYSENKNVSYYDEETYKKKYQHNEIL